MCSLKAPWRARTPTVMPNVEDGGEDCVIVLVGTECASRNVGQCNKSRHPREH